MQSTKLSLRGLEIFQLIAQTGSLREVASITGLSMSTISHHMRNIEQNLGVDLVDHTKRPMVLTPAGSVFLRYVDEGLLLIRRGEIELTSGNLAEVRDLRLGVVDDFDNEVAPELAQFLATAMPKCSFKHHTRPSHEIIRLLNEHKLDVGVASRPVNALSGMLEYPLLRDPLILALPVNNTLTPEEFQSGKAKLPFLRYSSNHIIGALIEAHLRRIKVVIPNRFELESNPSIMGMIADGKGWAITTPANFIRVKRFHNQITLQRMRRLCPIDLAATVNF